MPASPTVRPAAPAGRADDRRAAAAAGTCPAPADEAGRRHHRSRAALPTGAAPATERLANPGRRALGALAVLGAAGRAAATGREAAPGQVRLLVGAAAGGAMDLWARGFAPFFERHWPGGALVAVDNRPGEAGLLAARRLAEAAPDGRVIGVVATPPLLARAVEARAEAVLARLAFSAAVTEEPLVLIARAGSVEDLAGLRALGPNAVLGTPPPGSAAHLASAELGRALALDPLPFATAAAARKAVLAGNIPCALLAAPEAIGALRTGRLIGLGQAQDRRTALLPEVPTLTERGLPLRVAAHRGFAVPAGTDQALLRPALEALRRTVADPEFAEQANDQGYLPRFIGPTAWEPMLQRTLAELGERWRAAPWTGRQD